jgi:hypothetical protein
MNCGTKITGVFTKAEAMKRRGWAAAARDDTGGLWCDGQP